MAVRELEYANRWVIFGSGDIVQFEDYKADKLDSGEKAYKFYIYAGDNRRLRDRYDLKMGNEINPENGLMERKYWAGHVKPMDSGAKRTLIFIKCDPLGGETDFTRETSDKDDQIRLLERQYNSARVNNYRLTSQLNRLVENLPEELKRSKMMIDILTKSSKTPDVTNEQEAGGSAGDYSDQ